MELTPDAWARITELFDELVVLPPAAREVQLATAEPLVAREVRALLDAHTDDAFLEATPGRRPMPPVASTAHILGQVVGGYRVEREIGRGGMGVVYEARHVDASLAKRVAIKTLAVGLDRPEAAWRFRRERRILATLDHPNIAALYDGGTTADGQPYLIMEHVDGVRIDTWCEQRRLTIAQRIDLFRQVCAAVEFAHAKLVVHRDLKPNNILVTTDGVVKLLDFGIAKLATSDDLHADGHSELTRAGSMPLTTAYASPEQLRGDEVTTASDVYSLGVILYRLLTGVSPYGTDSVSPVVVRDTITSATLRSPSDAVTETQPGLCQLPNVSTLRRTLRGELDAIVLTALRAEPERRYAGAAALSADLLRFLKGLPVEARPDTLGYRVRTFVRRQRALVATGVIALLALVGGTAAALISARTARAEALRAQRTTSVMQEILGAGTSSVARYTQPPTLLTVLDSARVSVAREFPTDARTRADFYRTFGRSYLSFDRPDLAIRMLDSAALLHRRALGARSGEAAMDLLSLAEAMDVAGREDSAMVRRTEALAVLRTITPEPAAAITEAEIALGAAMIGGYIHEDDGLALLQRALPRARALPQPRWDQIAFAEAITIMPLSRQKGAAAADSAYQRSVAALARDSINSDAARTALAFQVQSLDNRNRGAEAVAPARLLLEKTVQRYGPDHVLVPQAQNLLAGALGKAGKPAEARVVFDSAIALTEQRAEPSSAMYLADMYAGRAMVEVQLHDEAAVRRSIARVQALAATLGAQRPTAEMTAQRILWTLEEDQGRLPAARAHLQRAVEIGRAAFGDSATRTVAAVKRLKDFDAAHPGLAAR